MRATSELAWCSPVRVCGVVDLLDVCSLVPDFVGMNPSLGWQIADWIEVMLCHGPGDVQGEPIHLDDEFAAVLARAYQVDPDTGRRLIRRYVFSRAKGRAKSELAGMIVCAEAVGPVRFDHWAVKGETSPWGYEYEKGEPVGRPVKAPFIRCLATEESQAGNTYDNVLFMLTSDDARVTQEYAGIDAGLTRVFLPGGGQIRPSTASNSAKDGGKETFAVFDETHLYVLPELRSMHATVRRNLVKRRGAEGWSLETTTMFEQGAGSVAESTFHAKDTGSLGRDVVFDHHSGPDPDSFDWEDDEQLAAAVAHAYGPAAEWMDIDRIVAEIRDPETSYSDAVRYFLNRPSSHELDVTSLSVWDMLQVPDRLEAGDTICVGFDGSERDDGTALVAVRAADGLTVPLRLWERPEGVKGWEVPRAEVRNEVDRTFATYRVARMYCDPRYWESDIDEWSQRYGDKTVFSVPSSDLRRAKAADRWEALVRTALQRLAAGDTPGSELSLCHDGNPDMRRHVGNARRLPIGGRAGKQGGWRPGKKKATRKIDLLDAAMLGHEARGDALANDELTPADDPGFVFAVLDS